MEYDVAISYANEIENKAECIVEYLKRDGCRVYYAPQEQQKMLSSNLKAELYDIYKNKSLVKVLLISSNYLETPITLLEKRVSLESTKNDRKRLIIVSYIEHEKLSDDLRNITYIDGRIKLEDEIAIIITDRVKILQNMRDKEYSFPYKRTQPTDIESFIDQQTVHIFNTKNNQGIITGDNATFGNIKL